jgi:hypothetical protein
MALSESDNAILLQIHLKVWLVIGSEEPVQVVESAPYLLILQFFCFFDNLRLESFQVFRLEQLLGRLIDVLNNKLPIFLVVGLQEHLKQPFDVFVGHSYSRLLKHFDVDTQHVKGYSTN